MIIVNGGGGGGTGAGGPLEIVTYDPGSVTTVTDTTIDDINAANLAVTFTVPASGSVLIRLSAIAFSGSSGQYVIWALREGTTTIDEARATADSVGQRQNVTFLVTGLTPGAELTYKWAQRNPSGGNANTLFGADGGPAIMEVWAVPL